MLGGISSIGQNSSISKFLTIVMITEVGFTLIMWWAPLPYAANFFVYFGPVLYLYLSLLVLVQGLLRIDRGRPRSLILIASGFVVYFAAAISIYARLMTLDANLNASAYPAVISKREAYYLSISTWTSLGYADLSPGPRLRFVAASEAVLGYLFVSTVIAHLFFEMQRNEKLKRQDGAYNTMFDRIQILRSKD